MLLFLEAPESGREYPSKLCLLGLIQKLLEEGFNLLICLCSGSKDQTV